MMAESFRCHHRLEGGEESGLTERTLCFLADKRVTLEDRMVDWIVGAFPPERAQVHHPRPGRTIELQYNQAQAVRHCLESAMGKPGGGRCLRNPVPRHLCGQERHGYGNGLPAESIGDESHGRK